MIERLTAFLYILMRDELPAGKVEAIVRDHVEKAGDRTRVYSNAGLEAYAREVATRIARGTEVR
jgi:hypothetical protein